MIYLYTNGTSTYLILPIIMYFIHNYECDYVINYTAANSMFTVLLFRILHTSITYYNLELLHSPFRNNAITLHIYNYLLLTNYYLYAA